MNRNEDNRFAYVPANMDISRSVFNRDHKVIFSFNVGDVVPFYVDEVVPGDTFSVNTSKVVRMQPLVTPIMDNVYLDTYYFYIPYRLVWNHWVNFMGENTESPWIPSVEYTQPQITIPFGGFDVGTIADYLGIPPKAGAGKTVSALPFRCYAKLCDDWFRDENLMNPVHLYVDDTTRTGSNGSDQVTDIELGGRPFIACKYHDYFTSCLPGAQKASPSTVQFALNGLLPVNAYSGKSTIKVDDPVIQSSGTIGSLHGLGYTSNASDNTFIIGANGNLRTTTSTATNDMYVETNGSPSNGTGYFSPSNLFADLNNTSVFDINELRQAFAIQKFYERQARSGSRYIETIKAFFNVDSPDARLQRSEYLGGNRLPLNVSACEQTSASQENLTPQGNLTGISATGDVNSDFTRSFTEHGLIIGVAVARYHHTYQQSAERFWFRKTKFDHYWPVFANLGEMGVKTQEIYFDADSDDVFGYQEAWADYRYKPSRCAGEMRSVYTAPLDSWHLADNYSSQPYLSDSWIREDKSMLDRCLAVTSSVSNQQ